MKLSFEGFQGEAVFLSKRHSAPCSGEAPIMRRGETLLYLKDNRSSPSIHQVSLVGDDKESMQDSYILTDNG